MQRRGMTQEFEAVVDVTEYYDGPRRGVAFFEGRPHVFVSRFVDVYSSDGADEDLFELRPVENQSEGVPILARAEFEVAADAPPTPPGELRKLVVRWTRCNPGV